MKPFIGITSSMEVDQSYYMIGSDNVGAITRAGGMPVMLPNYQDIEDIEQIANSIDGLYATGGYDIDPTLFGEEPHPKLGTIIPARDFFEITLMKKLLQMGKPILGVCRGAQTLNIAAGGDMYQDIYAQAEGALLQHQQKAPKEHGSHFVAVLEGSLLHRLTGEKKLRVNSRHHQANRSVATSFQVSGQASDGIIEAIESKDHPFALGLQWHPENMAPHQDEASIRIYEGFIQATQ
ncbi:putative glutamine amidotransferase [Oceanobacillus limi]|uniref:Putative glutamine amidotransferase n=1 Tax=Oceanobacillus limi TaxID=930131 RepID=A0A1I0FM12_9BACI|nr:gamma-glutamyl-gamma-aminobutyrate hydrolase family protein [Oceanobacillus limi]SET59344.1 putative glutamine amidotransferase [Oceanobacillus limi]